MKILISSPECVPFASSGGLGEVVGALPKNLVKLRNDVRVCIPLYGNILDKIKPNFIKHDLIKVHLGSIIDFCSVIEYRENNIIFYFIKYDDFFSSNKIYFGNEFDGKRFAFFCRATLEMCESINWIPDVIHCHDWTTGLIPVLLNTTFSKTSLNKTATVFTIHNLNYQGKFSKNILQYIGIPNSEFNNKSLEDFGNINYIKGGIYHSTKITTVSKNYANEIKTQKFGCGLDEILKFKSYDLIGITNGIDTDVWNPKTDKFIVEKYDAENLKNKKICKKDLQDHCNLEKDTSPILCIISRFDYQKGLDMLLNILPKILQNIDIKIIFHGDGDDDFKQKLITLKQKFNKNVRIYVGYDVELAHKIYAGSDFSCMPSRFEPCGINQMYSMIYGTLPIAHATGGLIDTIENYNSETNSGCGFLFYDLNEESLYNTIVWAYSIYSNNNIIFSKMQKNAMLYDFSWINPSKKYNLVYKWAIDTRVSAKL